MTLRLFLLIFTSVAMSACAQLLLKIGATRASAVSEQVANASTAGNLTQMLLSPFVWMGLLLYGIGTLVWLFVLAKVPLSVAYPFVGAGFILTALLGVFVLQETMTPTRGLGILLIVAGCTLVARTA
jgi:multidrug transporter EmrE-like cation transporter